MLKNWKTLCGKLGKTEMYEYRRDILIHQMSNLGKFPFA